MRRVYHPTANAFQDVENKDVKSWQDQGWTLSKKSHIDESEWPPAPPVVPDKRASSKSAAPKKTAAKKTAPTTTVTSGPADGFPAAGKSATAETVTTVGPTS